MKRFLCLLAVLALLSVGALTAVGLAVGGAKDDVVITEEVLYGDASVASDVTVSAVTHYDRRLFWTTTYPLGGAAGAQTEFACYPGGKSEWYDWGDSGLEIRASYHTSVGSSGSGTIPLEDLSQNMPFLAVQAVAQRTSAGETREEILTFKDYYDVYPLGVSLDSVYTYTREWERAFSGIFSAYCAIPVPPEQKITVSVTKNGEGGITRVQCNTDESMMDLVCQSVVEGDTIYFTLSQTGTDAYGTPLPDRLPDRLRGIHRVDLTRGDDDTAGIVPDSLRRVFPLDATAGRVTHLVKSEDGARLLMVTENGDGATLSVLSKETMALLQTIPLSDRGGTIDCLRQGPGFWAAIFSNGTFDLISDGPDGALTIQLTENFTDDIGQDQIDFNEMALSYDGSRLAAAYTGYRPGDKTYEACAVTVMVYDPTGLLYAGRYRSSADRAYQEDSEGQYVHGVQPVGEDTRVVLTFGA